jgi:hypothetical protein
VLCLETVLRLFYWARLAYRNEEKLDYKWVNEAGGRALFGLDHAEALWDEDSDTHAVLGWSASAAVVAFRGTSSLQNTITDLKSWRVPLVPRRRHGGRLVTVHAGFQKAWLHNDFNKKVGGRGSVVRGAWMETVLCLPSPHRTCNARVEAPTRCRCWPSWRRSARAPPSRFASGSPVRPGCVGWAGGGACQRRGGVQAQLWQAQAAAQAAPS